jgi:excisionase family DNA binding protein
MEESRYMDIKKVCRYTCRSTSSIYKKVMKKEIPYIKVGGKLIFDKIKIDEWMLNGGNNGFDLPDIPLN